MTDGTTDNLNSYYVEFCKYELYKKIKKRNTTKLCTDIISNKELFEFIEMNFEELHDNQVLRNVLELLHYAMREKQMKFSNDVNIRSFLSAILKKYANNEHNQKIIVQILYQILNSLSTENDHVKDVVSADLLKLLCDIVVNCSTTLATRILYCLQLYIRKFDSDNELIARLWRIIVPMREKANRHQRLSQILVHLIDDFLRAINEFHKDENFIDIITMLLVSRSREERKAATYLLRKRLSAETERYAGTTMATSWMAYITILENLEEKQSHLILPTLENIKNIKLERSWMDLLYEQLLAQDNVLVSRWIVDKILTTCKCADLEDKLLKRFLMAVNRTSLYDCDNFCLEKEKVQNFLNCDLHGLLIAFAENNWQSVPLHYWLSELSLNLAIVNGILMETLLKIAARIRTLQNRNIRRYCIEMFEHIFAMRIKSLDITEYLTLLETLYNTWDCYENYDILEYHIRKSSTAMNIRMSSRLYHILTVHRFPVYLQNIVIDFLEKIAVEEHGWFRFMVIFDFESNEKQKKFCKSQYNIDLSMAGNIDGLKKMLMEKMLPQLDCSLSEKSFVNERAMDYYVTTQMRDHCSLDVITWYLQRGGRDTLVHFATLIKTTQCRVTLDILKNLLMELVNYVHSPGVCDLVLNNLLSNCEDQLCPELASQFADEILKVAADLNIPTLLTALFKSNVHCTKVEDIIDILFQGYYRNGDARIERKYELQQKWDTSSKFPYLQLHLNNQDLAIEYVMKRQDVRLEELVQYILAKNDELSRKKPRYFQHSNTHRFKIRCVKLIMDVLRISKDKIWLENYWNSILNQNNQLDITILYERIIAYCCPGPEEILARLSEVSKYSASQQVSIVVICHCYAIIHWSEMNDDLRKNIIEMLLPLTMGAKFQTRLYAQLVLYKLLQLRSFTDYGEVFVRALHSTIGDEIDELLKDIRLEVSSESILSYDVVLFVTGAPLDEYHRMSVKDINKYSGHMRWFAKRKPLLEEAFHHNNIIEVQRKMKIPTDVLPHNDLISYPEYKECDSDGGDIIIVATLIDKLPNLGGIARSCESLGVKKLILRSMKYVEQSEFRNVSMTAEKYLDISEVKSEELLEYLLHKQSEGFNIVGAEQTSMSENFAVFKFPKKCIILLGNEKEGIPANLLSVLDHTVEIHQVGLVRSLNVHVTAALFMWEYHKQHFLRK